jgi:hypothetical protein
MIRHQLSIFVENEPGVLARVARALADGGVNLRAISVSDNADDAVLRIVVDDERQATHILEQTGALCVTREVVEVDLPDKPGALAGVAALLAAKNINISYAYGSGGGGGGGKAALYLRIPGPQAAEADAAIQAHLAKLA